MSKAAAFLAGMGAGYLDNERRKEEDARRDKREKRDQELHDARMSDIKRQASDRDALRKAAAPVAVESGEVYQPAVDDEGNAMPANPTSGTYMVGARRFAERGVAEAEAASQNDPRAVRGRVMRELAAQGNVVAADQMRTSGIQADAAQLSLEQAVRKMRDEGASRALAAAISGQSPDQVAALYNAQGEHKVSNLRIEPFETNHPVLGKQRSARITGTKEDGTPFEVKDALAMHFDMFSAEKKLEAQFKAKDDARADRQVDIAQQNADTNERYRRDMAENARLQRELNEKKANLGGQVQVDLKDIRDFGSDLNARIKDKYPVKDGIDEKEKAAISAKRAAEEAMGTAYFRSNATLGIPLTAGTVEQAMSLAADRANIKPWQHPNGKTYGVVIVHGQPVVVTGEMTRKPPPAAATVAPAPNSPAAAAARGVTPSAQTATPVPNGPQALGSRPDQMPDQELAAIPPGHPAYETAQQILAARAAARAQAQADAGGFNSAAN